MAEKALPNYDVVALRSEEITVAAVQMATKRIEDPKKPKETITHNLNNMLSLIDYACMMSKADLLVFPEMALQGFGPGWRREEWLSIAFDVPGEELERIGEKAKKYNCYIVVCCYIKDKDWPNHYFNSGIILGPSGKVILNHWKARWAPQLAAYCTTVHDVLDEFIERYGWDAVWPVARTDIGNIAVYICSEGFQPETARAYAFKGAEIFTRPCGGCGGGARSDFSGYTAIVGDPVLGMRVQCQENNCYGVFANTGYGPGVYGSAGSSMIIDGYGRVLQEAKTESETVVTERIPIALFRKQHSIPLLRKELYAPVYEQYQGKYPANLFLKYLPKDTPDSLRYHSENARW